MANICFVRTSCFMFASLKGFFFVYLLCFYRTSCQPIQEDSDQETSISVSDIDLHIEVSDGSTAGLGDLFVVTTFLRSLIPLFSGGFEESMAMYGLNTTETPFVHIFYYYYVLVGPVGDFSQETPIFQRYYPYWVIVYYEVWACIHGRESLIGLTVCENLPPVQFTKSETMAAMGYGGLLLGRKINVPGMFLLLEALEQLGYKDDMESVDTSTPAGIGNTVAQAFFEYQAVDGWNWDGTMTRTVNPMPFEDYTGYAPMNSPWKLNYPLRWQPLLETDNQGFFYYQQHVTPQAGLGQPIAFTKEEFDTITVDWPYTGGRENTELAQEDEDVIREYAEELFLLQQNLTDTQKMLIWYFDSKGRSIAAIPLWMEAANEIIKDDNRQLLTEVGFNTILYDATVLVWKEKLRHDAVRPPSIIKYIYQNETIEAWGGYGKGAAVINGTEFSPYIRTMPHSEFPSASACICQATTDFLRAARGGKDEFTSPFIAFFRKGSSVYEPDVVPAKDTVVIFRSLSEINRVCGESRLWGGLHFRPAVEAGQRLCKGLGERVYERLVSKSNIEF
eukprot:TRINITY_DN5720_c1_g2_i4.p1 TRINITY_DN5720_c1_g2~~TRINITY_DN5720_c1_g2_i4.p1  ORF type:complete len:561 (-),score=33.65 TRINITY_DN5720_c1_g2_i4:264-1946(-)